jgi:hypothetical protein
MIWFIFDLRQNQFVLNPLFHLSFKCYWMQIVFKCKTRYNWCIYFDKADHISDHPVKSRQGLNKSEYMSTRSSPGWWSDLLAYHSVYLLGFICNNSTSYLCFHFLFRGGPIWTVIIIARAHYIFAVLHLWMMISPSLARRRHFLV